MTQRVTAGMSPEPVFNWDELLDNKNKEIRRLNDIYENLLEYNGVRLYNGRAELGGPNTVLINGESIRRAADTGSNGWLAAYPGHSR